jgi:UDP-glucose 6-dehydrogenase
MKIAIIGPGHVGFTGLCCPADQGHEVAGFDVSRARVEAVRAGRISAHETLPGHIDGCDIAIVRVGTPRGPDGALDMRHIASARDLAVVLQAPRATP